MKLIMTKAFKTEKDMGAWMDEIRTDKKAQEVEAFTGMKIVGTDWRFSHVADPASSLSIEAPIFWSPAKPFEAHVTIYLKENDQ